MNKSIRSGIPVARKAWLAGIQGFVNLTRPAIMFLDCSGKTPKRKNIGVSTFGPNEHHLAQDKNPATGMKSPLYHRIKVDMGNKKCNLFC